MVSCELSGWVSLLFSWLQRRSSNSSGVTSHEHVVNSCLVWYSYYFRKQTKEWMNVSITNLRTTDPANGQDRGSNRRLLSRSRPVSGCARSDGLLSRPFRGAHIDRQDSWICIWGTGDVTTVTSDECTRTIRRQAGIYIDFVDVCAAGRDARMQRETAESMLAPERNVDRKTSGFRRRSWLCFLVRFGPVSLNADAVILH
jgi:hypothetical protein